MDNLLTINNITKKFGSFYANNRISFGIKKGEILTVLGENGAGKSTLMKVLFGLETPEQGQIILNDIETTIKSPQDAISKGIGMVHQHFMLVPSLTVAENIILGVEPAKSKLFIDMNKAVEISNEIADK